MTTYQRKARTSPQEMAEMTDEEKMAHLKKQKQEARLRLLEKVMYVYVPLSADDVEWLDSERSQLRPILGRGTLVKNIVESAKLEARRTASPVKTTKSKKS